MRISLVSQSANGSARALVASTLAVVEGLGPGTVSYGSGGELVKALAQKLRTGVAQAMGAAFAAGLGNRCDAAQCAHRFRVREA